MPDSTESPAVDGGASAQTSTEQHLRAEIVRLQSELDQRAGAELSTWLKIVRDESRLLRDIRNTLSWRVTKPLRAARVVQLKVAEVGLVRTSQLAVADLRRRYRGRRR
ncbi:hypothetical protein WDJ51_02170 [Rathayibacter sp. YIM 133350]|uniref:hypothetical protein n=1 Tax=Rathayibacter sp. YIM 133350 TaxID=3131992 RepID=UPI00307D633F